MTKKIAPSGIAPGAEVIYSITISSLDNGGIKHLSNHLGRHGIPESYRHITPAADGLPGQIDVPRLFTHWRGDADEQAWTEALRSDVTKLEPTCQFALGVAPWAPLPGYPQGAIE